RFRFPFDKECALFTQKQIFGRDAGGGPEAKLYKGQCVEKNAEDFPKRVQKGLHPSILLTIDGHLFGRRTNFLRTTGCRQLGHGSVGMNLEEPARVDRSVLKALTPSAHSVGVPGTYLSIRCPPSALHERGR